MPLSSMLGTRTTVWVTVEEFHQLGHRAGVVGA
jgi:hypothetical protein